MNAFLSLLDASGLTRLDMGLLVLLCIGWPLWELTGLATFRRRLATIGPGGRSILYLRAGLILWAITGAVIAVWFIQGRDLHMLGFAPVPADAWGAAAWTIVAAITGLMLMQLLVLAFSSKARGDYREAFDKAGDAVLFLPATGGELRTFSALGITAGITEEIIFRGYLIWAFAAFVGLPLAALLSLGLFVLMHSYQGGQGLVQVAVAGSILTALFLMTGSLLPCIVLHIVIDLLSAQIHAAGRAERTA